MTSLIVLAGGLGKRMQAALPKPLLPLAGKPMIMHVIDTALSYHFKEICVVVPQAFSSEYRQQLKEKPLHIVEQVTQGGTGEAVALALSEVVFSGQVMIWCADIPLITIEEIQAIDQKCDSHAINLVTFKTPSPYGMGRIIRGQNQQQVCQIVEEKDATDQQRQIQEVYSGMMQAPASTLKELLASCNRNNQQREILLTDIVGLAKQKSLPIHAVLLESYDSFLGINDASQWSLIERIINRRRVESLQRQGVRIVDPNRCDIRGSVQVGFDVSLDVGVILEGEVVLGDGCRVGAYSSLKNVHLESGVEIKNHCVIEETLVQSGAKIGPFAYCRVGNQIGSNAKVGAFVELKKTSLGNNTKASHLSYLGDSKIGDFVNIGAGVITCNYDGQNKHATMIESHTFVGAGVELVAPIKLGKGALIGAGSTITHNVDSNALAIARVRQKVYENWTQKQKKDENVVD